MSSTTRHVLLIVFVGGIVLFGNLGGPRLWDRDEPRNAGCTREMLARGDWITPVFDGELRTHKPILLYWFMMTAYALFGVGEFAARFWSASAALGTALVTYGLGRRLFSPAVGLWAALVLVTTLMFDVAARAATPDSLLMFWSTASLGAYVWGTRWTAGDPRSDDRAASMIVDQLFPFWPGAVLMYGCMGMAVLAKGPVGFLLPTAVIGMYLLLRRLPPRTATTARTRGARAWTWAATVLRPFAPRHFLQTCWSMRPLTALIVVATVAVPWYAAVAWRTDGEWVRGFLMDHNIGRATQSLEGHNGWILYYPLALLVGFFPWSVFAVPAAIDTRQRWRVHPATRPGTLLALCWLGVYVGLFSVAKTKLPSYITPSYPAVALLVASFVVAWKNGTSQVPRLWLQAAFVCLGIVGLVILVAVPIAAARFLPGEYWLAALGLIPVLTALAGLWLIRRHVPSRAVAVFASGAVALTTGIFAVGAARVDSHQEFDALVTTACARSADPQFGALGIAEPSWVFYSGRPLDRLVVPGFATDAAPSQPGRSSQTAAWAPKPVTNLSDYLSRSPDHFAITSRDYLNAVGGLPGDLEIITQTPYFLQDDILLLLAARRPQEARRENPPPTPNRR